LNCRKIITKARSSSRPSCSGRDVTTEDGIPSTLCTVFLRLASEMLTF
jgi:hypothetical protein